MLDALLEVLPEELANGNIVDLGEVGSFWLRNTATGVDEEDKVSAKQMTNLLVRFFPGRELRKALGPCAL